MNTTNNEKENVEVKKFERKYYLDWLRVIAVYSVFFFHLAVMFGVTTGYHITNNERFIGFDFFVYILGGFGMPLFFTISGMGVFYAFKYIKGLDGKTFIKERFVRLMIPFFVGIFTHISIQVYIEQVYAGTFTGNFFEFYLQYFNGLQMFGGNFPLWGYNLWTLAFLFIDCLIAVKVFTYFSQEKNQEKLSKIAYFFQKPGAIYLFAIPLLLIEIFDPLREFGVPRITGWHFFSYLTFLLIGFFLASDKRYEQTLEQHNLPAFFVAVFTAILLLPMAMFILNQVITRILVVFYGWSLLILILNLGRKFMNKKHKSLKFLNDVALPFYIIHQTVLLVVGFFVLQIDLLIILKYLIISGISLGIIFGLIFIIRQANVLRFLFGMRLKKKKKKEEMGTKSYTN